MEFLAGLYTLLLVAICLLQALLLHRTGKPAAQQDDEALKEWLRQQLEAQARVLEESRRSRHSRIWPRWRTSAIPCKPQCRA